MSAESIDGAAIAAEIRAEVKQRVEALASTGRSLKLVAVIAGAPAPPGRRPVRHGAAAPSHGKLSCPHRLAFRRTS